MGCDPGVDAIFVVAEHKLLSAFISFSVQWRFETEFLNVLRPSALYITHNQKETRLLVEDFAAPDYEATNLIAIRHYRKEVGNSCVQVRVHMTHSQGGRVQCL
jgi:hypothetical protein